MESKKHIQSGITLSDKNFIPRLAANFRLIIYLNADQLVFSVSDILSRKLLLLRSFTFFNIISQDDWVKAVQSIINSEADLHLPYGKITVEYLTQNMTMVPAPYFIAEESAGYYHFNISNGGQGMSICNTDAINGEVQIVYSIHEELKLFLEKTYPSVRIIHAASPLINTILQLGEKQPVLYAYIQPSLMQVIITENKQLKFCNTFSYKTPEDFIYYLLYAAHQLELDNEKTSLVLLGEILEDSAIYKQIYKYIRNISFGNRPAWLSVADEIKFPSHFYFNLFCEV